jgi:glycosyltransferase involved in cell wall biosynthesis
MFRLVLVSREVFPFESAGLGAYVTATADTLAGDAQVTILTTERHRARYDELRAASSPLLPRRGVHFEFVREPSEKEVEGYFNYSHLWSVRVLQRLRELYPDEGPELIEFPDYLGEGAATVQARLTLERRFRQTMVCLRLYTPSEMTSVLNGFVLSEPGARHLFDLERYALAHADRILWPGGDVLGTYERFYEGRLAPATLVRHPVLATSQEPEDEPADDGELRFLYVGRLERRKGVQDLVRAATALERTDWRLRLVGGDTDTGPLGTSLRAQLELAVADDPRIELLEARSRNEVIELLRGHDVLVAPSRWECWPNAALEAFSQNRPVLATPVGGYVELVRPGFSGWLTNAVGPEALTRSLEHLLDHRDEISALIESRGPQRRFSELTDPEEVRAMYAELAEEAAARGRGRSRPKRPLVSVVIPYFRLDRYVEETVRSIFEQTYDELEVIIVNDGSFRTEDEVLGELADRYPLTVLVEQQSGLGAARNFGVSQSRGAYVLPLDADDVALPTFVERCVEVLQERSEVAFVNSWVRYMDDGGRLYRPPAEGNHSLSNELFSLDVLNVAGAAAAVIRRRVFDLGFWYSADATSYEDWLFYRELAQAGLYGHSIPEQLLHYRVREASMLRDMAHRHHERLAGELDAHARERQVQWTS